MPRTPDDVREAGSHFLARDSPWVGRMVEAARLQPGETVLDAGAGVGSITTPIAAKVAPGGLVLAVERDQEAAESLRGLGLDGVRVVEGDVLKVNLPSPLHAVVANPPFRILPGLLKRLLDHGFGRAVLVMPEELMQRLTAQPKSDEYGRLTVEVGLRAKCTLLFPLPRKAFDPPPAVRCAVVQVTPKPQPDAPVDQDVLPLLLDAAWKARRKTLRHSLAPLAGALGVPPQDVTLALDTVKGGDRTASDVSPWEYGQLANRLAEAQAARAKPGSKTNRTTL